MGNPATDGGLDLWALRRAAVDGDVPVFDAARGRFFPNAPASPPGLCLVEAPPGNVQALVGQNVAVNSEVHPVVIAPADPVDCDQFAVTLSPSGSSPIGSVPIVGFDGESFFPSSGTTVRIMQGTMVFQFKAGEAPGVWWVVDSPVVQPDGGANGLAVGFNNFALVSDSGGPAAIIDWVTGADNTTNRWAVDVELTDQASGDIAQFRLDATFRRDGASVVTQKALTSIVSVAQGTIAAATVQFSIAGQTVTLEVTGVVGVAAISALSVGEIHEVFG